MALKLNCSEEQLEEQKLALEPEWSGRKEGFEIRNDKLRPALPKKSRLENRTKPVRPKEKRLEDFKTGESDGALPSVGRWCREDDPFKKRRQSQRSLSLTRLNTTYGTGTGGCVGKGKSTPGQSS